MCVTKKKKKIVIPCNKNNDKKLSLSLSLSLSLHQLSDFSVKFTKGKINHLNKKKIKEYKRLDKKRIETVLKHQINN